MGKGNKSKHKPKGNKSNAQSKDNAKQVETKNDFQDVLSDREKRGPDATVNLTDDKKQHLVGVSSSQNIGKDHCEGKNTRKSERSRERKNPNLEQSVWHAGGCSYTPEKKSDRRTPRNQENQSKQLPEKKSSQNDLAWENDSYSRGRNPPKETNAKTKSVELNPMYSNVKDDKFKDDKFKDYLQWSKRKHEYVRVAEIEADLFEQPKEYSLAHCVAADMNMGSGIAVQFSQIFKRHDELYQQRQKQGGMAVLEHEGRFIYYLVTKRESNGKPTYNTLWCSLLKLHRHMVDNKVVKLAIPRIGCGLDRLEWSDVKAMLEYVFQDTNINITVCNYQQPEYDSSQQSSSVPPKKLYKSHVVNASYPLVDIDRYSAIVYFGYEDGYVTEEIDSLAKKFPILNDYKTKTKRLGETIVTSLAEYVLYGFIVRKRKNDLFDFISLQKCVSSLNKNNRGDKICEYVGIQAFLDEEDDLLLEKIVNQLRIGLYRVTLYVCWPKNLSAFMPTSFY